MEYANLIVKINGKQLKVHEVVETYHNQKKRYSLKLENNMVIPIDWLIKSHNSEFKELPQIMKQ